MAANAKQISKKRKFVADGVFYSELNEFLTRELGEDGYAGVEIRVTPIRTEIIVRATRTREVLGEKGRRIRELTSLVQKRFGFRENSVELFAEAVNNRGCCAMAQAESLRYKLLGMTFPILIPNSSIRSCLDRSSYPSRSLHQIRWLFDPVNLNTCSLSLGHRIPVSSSSSSPHYHSSQAREIQLLYHWNGMPHPPVR